MPRIYREYKNLGDLDAGAMTFPPVIYRTFSEEEQREIVFKDITTGEVTHTTMLDTAGVADYRSVIGYFARTVMKELRFASFRRLQRRGVLRQELPGCTFQAGLCKQGLT